MTTSLLWDALVLAARMVVAGVFLVAGVAKLRSGGFDAAVAEYEVLPKAVARPFARVLPVLEIVIGVLVLSGIGTGWPALGAFLLSLAFLAAVLVNLRRGRALQCHCMGAGSGELMSPVSAVRLVGLALLAALGAAPLDARTVVSSLALAELIDVVGLAAAVAVLLHVLSPAATLSRQLLQIARARRFRSAGTLIRHSI